MNKVLLWLAQTQVTKIARYLLAAIGAWLVKEGINTDHTNLFALLGGLASWGVAVIWSVAHKAPGFDWVDKVLASLDVEDKKMIGLWIDAAIKKGIAALFVVLATKTGVQLDAATTTEGAIGILLTWLLSKRITPDPVNKTRDVTPTFRTGTK